MGGPGGSDRRGRRPWPQLTVRSRETGSHRQRRGSSFMKLGSEEAEDKVGDEQCWIEGEFL